MEGILSGFRFSSKKAVTKEPSPEVKNQAQSERAGRKEQTKSTEKTVSSAPLKTDGAVTEKSKAQTLHDRSPTMRLTKNTPDKPVDNDFDIPADPVIPSYSSAPAPFSAAKASQSSTPSAIIGPKITFKGELTGEEDLLILGRVEGTIDLKGNHLTVGPQGVVKANLMAKTITIEGTVDGDVIGQERIEIKSSSNVKGNLVASRVTLEDGAKFRGSIDMDSSNSGKSSSTGSSSSSSSFSSTTTADKSDKA